MKTVGLITEYNPFHNGHQHHVRESLRRSGAEASVAVMSGHFLQRGEPALVDKWVRTEMALAAGVDLVVELPLPFACNSAPFFAAGAVRLLAALGVDALCFGSEAGRLEELLPVARVLEQHADEVARQAAGLLRDGLNYPTARARVLRELVPELPTDLLASPNNILGLEYLRALRSCDTDMAPLTIERLGPGYHDLAAVGRIASATGIWRMLVEGRDVADYLPEEASPVFADAWRAGRCLDPEKLFTLLLGRLLPGEEGLDAIYQIEHGLAARLTEAAQQTDGYAALAMAVKSRHWTLTRIQRILAYVLLQVDKRAMTRFLDAGPLYLRVLGMSGVGQRILASSRSKRTLPLIVDPAGATRIFRRFYRGEPCKESLAKQMLELDLRATRIYTALLRTPWQTHRNRDFFEPVKRKAKTGLAADKI